MKKLDIIYEDKELLVVNKPSKMLTISDGKTDNTLYSMAREYVKKQHKSNKIFIVHRLDKDTSGIVLFAKNEKLKNYLQDNWNNISNREYIAILEGKLNNSKGIIKNYLLEDKTHKVYISNNKKGEYAETHYEVINYTKNNTLVKINIKTGKKNQIRVAFSNLGYPIIGDKKYGSISNSIKRLGLHALKLNININNKIYNFETKIPKEFLNYYEKN
ncbi:MAG: RNA pseudouridine synthase [Firmicutes bacterium]|nr:RNA pseudouridine synthase [Bacillota bacterium]